MANINTQNVSKAEEAYVLAKEDMLSFGKLFLADDFMRSETPWFHYEIADDIMNHNKKQLAIIMPRGHGKTVLTKCDLLWSFCFAKKDDPLFYGWVSATQKLASGNMDYVKTHLEFNDKIKYYFGNQKGRKWTEEDIELANGCKLLSKSNVSGIRGGAKLHKRYDLIILDDFEDENNTLTPEARAKNGNLITAVVYPALEPHTGRLRINGTPVHYDSFINNLITNSEQAKKEGKKDFAWDVKLYKAIDDKGNSLWHSWFPKEKLEEKKKFYRDSGMPHKFYQEYMMQVQSEEDSIFNSRHIKYWEGHYEWNEDHQLGYIWHDDQLKPVQTFVGVDPATDVNRRGSDYSVLMVVAVDMNNSIYVLDYIRQRDLTVMSIVGEDKAGIVDYMFDYAHKYHPLLQVVEDTTMSRPIFQALRSESMRRNDFTVKWKEEKPGTRMSKRDRIQEVLQQRFAIGQIFMKKNHYDLHHEIVTFGNRMAHDDTIDALAYACKYATPPRSLVKENGIFRKESRSRPKNWVLA